MKLLSEMSKEELWQLFPIILKKHNREYKNWYLIEKENIESYFDKNIICRINHIGSTSVPGLIAKPTVDILLEINKESDMEKLTDILLAKGWILMSSQKEPYQSKIFNKGYTQEGFAEKVYHLHVRYYGDWKELYFKDYLIENNDLAEKYGIMKLELIKKYKHNRDGYTDAKTDFISKYTELAIKKYKGRYEPVE